MSSLPDNVFASLMRLIDLGDEADHMEYDDDGMGGHMSGDLDGESDLYDFDPSDGPVDGDSNVEVDYDIGDGTFDYHLSDELENEGEDDSDGLENEEDELELPQSITVTMSDGKEQEVEVLSLYPGPRIFTLPNFLSQEEIDAVFDKINASMPEFRDTQETGISLEMRIDGEPVLEKIAKRQYELFGHDNKAHGTFRTRRYIEEKVCDDVMWL